MKVTVHYMAHLKQAAGVACELIELGQLSTVSELVKQLAGRHGETLQRLLLDGLGRRQATVLLFVNDQQVSPESDMILSDGDEVSLLSPIAGGSGQPLTDEEKAVYEWQMWVPGFGTEGQEKLKGASVLLSRVGGVGGMVAYQLAAAGVGRLVLAHGGDVKPSDLNRQLLMTHDWLGRPRIESAARRLRELNPRLNIEAAAENVTEGNVERLVRAADLVVDCAPLFQERFLLNREAVRQRKPMVECAMYELEGQLTTIVPGRTPCLACLYPGTPPAWTRQFPVFGAVAGTVACLGTVEAIKVITGLGEPLLGRLLTFDLRAMTFRKAAVRRNPDCAVCGDL